MRSQLIKAVRFNMSLDMIYVSSGGVISKRRIKVLYIDGGTFQAYCFLRKSKRTFKIDNILALVPVIEKESVVV